MVGQLRLSLAVASGSALGAVARYLCSIWMMAMLGPHFPWGTLSVNIVGSFTIGLFAALVQHGKLWATPTTRHFVMTGFCGGFTTFSIFSLETLSLLQRGDWRLASLYVASSIVLWLAAVWLGHWIGSSKA